MSSLPSRKALELNFRRWIAGTSPARKITRLLTTKDRQAYIDALGSEGEFDHIVPLSAFNLAEPSQIALAWSRDNLQRIPRGENKNKGASLESAYLTLLSRAPIDPAEYTALLQMLSPVIASRYPSLSITRKL